MSLLTMALLMAADPLDPNDVKPGWVALGIVVLLGVATFFLAKSFLKHSRRAQQPWDGEEPSDDVES